MKRLLSLAYIFATMLIVVGALFIFQNADYGLTILMIGLTINILYRLIILKWSNVLQFKLYDIFKLVSILFLIFACVYMFSNNINKFNFLIIAIVLDLIINLKSDNKKMK